jgi:hypothetical protein
LVLPLWVFADEWEGKPDAPVCVGLRLMSSQDTDKARSVAEQHADELHPMRGDNWVDCFNDAIRRQIAALGMCSPNDLLKPPEILPLPEDQVLAALTPDGAAFIYRAIDQYAIETSSITVPASAPELERLANLLPLVQPEALDMALRRLITHVTDEIDLVVGDLVDAGTVDHPGYEVAPVIDQ